MVEAGEDSGKQLFGYLDLSSLRSPTVTDNGAGTGGAPRVPERFADNADRQPSLAGDGLPCDMGRSNSAARDRS